MTILVVGKKNDPKAVFAAQMLLGGQNVFHHQTLYAPHNQWGAKFDSLEAIASRDMKWWLGYPLKDCTMVFGDTLRDYLLGKKKLSVAMHARRVTRSYEPKPPPKPTSMYLFPVIEGAHWKLIGVPGQGTHSFSAPPNNWQSDNALDLGIAIGTKLVATRDGKIGSRIGKLTSDSGGRFAGIRLYLECDNGNQFYYAHLSYVNVKAGQHVVRGQLLGHSGEANGVPHLHIGEMHGDPMHDLLGRPQV